jgi:hypothetical protein
VEQLTEIEKELIAGLSNHPAFLLLLKVLEVSISGIEEEMMKIPNERDAMWAFTYWKALKKIYKFLATQPEMFGKELEMVLNERREAMGGADFDPLEIAMRLNNYAFTGPTGDEV